MPVLARAASGDPAHLARVLDTGIAGFIVPSVTSADGAAALVQAVRFPPEGVRGTGLTRGVLTGGPERPLPEGLDLVAVDTDVTVLRAGVAALLGDD